MKFNPRHAPVEHIPHEGKIGITIISFTWIIIGVSLYYILLASPAPPASYSAYENKTGLPFPSYYALFATVVPTILWIWAVIAWLGMKFFRNG